MIATNNRVTRNAVFLTATKVATPFVSLVLVLAVSHYLGAEGLGRYTLVLAYVNIFAMLTPLGLNALLMREGSRDIEQLPQLLGNAVVLTGGASVIGMPLMAALGFWLGYDATTCRALALASLSVLPSTLLLLFDAAFVSRQRFIFIGVGTTLDLLLRVGGAVVCLQLGFGILSIVACLVGSQVLVCVLYAFLLSRIGIPPRLRFEGAILRRLLSAVPTFLLLSIFATLYWRVDVLMLSVMGSLVDVGLYGAAYRFVELVKIVPQSLCLAVYPLVSEAALADPARVKYIGNLVLRYLWAIAIPVAVGGTLLAGPILAFTVGEEFRPAASTLIVLIWTTIPYVWMRYYAYVIVAANREHVDLRLNIVMSVVNVGLNVALIPAYGALGSAIATLIAVCLFAAAQYVYLRWKLTDHLAALPPLLKPVFASLLMGVGVWSLRDRQILFVIAVGTLIYFGVLIVSRFFQRHELRALGLDRLVERWVGTSDLAG